MGFCFESTKVRKKRIGRNDFVKMIDFLKSIETLKTTPLPKKSIIRS